MRIPQGSRTGTLPPTVLNVSSVPVTPQNRGKAPFSDLKKCPAVLTPVKGIFHPNFSGKKGPENSGSL